ncbi:MAG: Tripartite DNA replication factor [Pycnora praestabilis]|nr:MAG: Tripartite DNA replication factor [Pycnora praestabilis]
MTAPLISSSAATKSKLKPFQFAEDVEKLGASNKTSESDSNKENHILTNHSNDAAAITGSSQARSSNQNGNAKSTKDCPKTPATRLPLADLIANVEYDMSDRRGQDVTPDERVYWEHTRSPDSSGQTSSLVTPDSATRRGKKRARSSSPPSASANGVPVHNSANKEIFDLQNLQKMLKTPQADPAAELWSRYAIATGSKSTLEGLPVSAFAHLINASSPHTWTNGTSANASSGLRRSLSCGMEWPLSKAKRRRVTGPEVRLQGEDIFAVTNQDPEKKGVAKISRLNLLVERMQKSLAKPSRAREISGLSSSSPLPEKIEDNIAPYVSPLQRLVTATERVRHTVSFGTTDNAELRSNVSIDKMQIYAPSPKETSSEFGDFDDDEIDMLEAAEAASCEAVNGTNIAQEPSTERLPQSQHFRDDGTEKTKLALHLTTAANFDDIAQTTVGLEDQEESDEFGEDDEQLLTADLEDFIAKYDTQSNLKRPAQDTVSPSVAAKPPTLALPANNVRQQEDVALVITESAGADCLSDDEFGGEDIDFEHLVTVEATSTDSLMTVASSQIASNRKVRAIKRYLIEKVAEGEYELSNGRKRSEKVCPSSLVHPLSDHYVNLHSVKVLLVYDENTKLSKAITLRESWFDSPCTTGSYIHLIGDFDIAGQCIVDDTRNMIILHPDHLISSTVVADSFSCTRRAVLQDRVKATNDANAPQVYGHILHEIFQEAMKANRWDTIWLFIKIEEIVSRYIESIYEIKIGVQQAVDYLKSKMPEVQAWAQVFVSARPKDEALVENKNERQAMMSVKKLLDVEEHVWSPMYGLKGNIDATVQVIMRDGKGEKTLTVPFEIKTGKNNTNPAHRAQTVLYTLLLSDRYDVEIAYGILYYMETSHISRIPAIRHELRQMVIQRNELACYVRHRMELPPMLKSPHLCGKCYAKTPCFIYHKLVDDGDGETSGMKEKFDEVVQHLKPQHQSFFQKWDDLLTKEEKDVMKFRRELWTMLSVEREKLGRCFSNVVIEPGSAYEAEDGPKINRFRYTFIKQNAYNGFSFAESQITVGEPVVVSDEKGHFALANGYVTHVRKRRITVAVDRRLHNARVKRPGFDAKNNQVFAGVMEVCEDGEAPSTLTTREMDEPVSYRLDKDEFSNGMATVRNNLIQVMANGPIGSREIRSLVVELQAPIFKAVSTAYTPPDSASQASLNVDQKTAIKKVMSAQDYALVLGMPGTGKTTTIAHIIRALVSQGKSVLLTSYTHTAVDNILLKIQNDNIPILRLGAIAKIHPGVQEFAVLAGVPKKTVEELHDAYHKPPIVATTCLGINHPIFNERVFDYCIVDEASQITLPVCLGPIRMAKTFILVGDHYQLPPLVQNGQAREGGLDISLFKLLSEKHPSSVVNLEHQYRMCRDIMMLSNTLIYEGRLKCGTESVANRSITIPNFGALKQHHHNALTSSALPSSQKAICSNPNRGSCWLRDLLDPSVKACFINTDPLLPASREDAKGSRIVNASEAALCTQLVEALLTTGVAGSDIGVITLYRSQLALIKQNLRHRSDVEMHTADKFQGRDKDVVILSLVRSNEQKNVGDLLKDWRRVNVAFTRARTKLLVLGSQETLRSNDLLKQFLELMDDKGWRYDLPKGATEGHLWDDGLTQLSMTSKASKASPAQKSLAETGKSKGLKAAAKVGKMNERAFLGSRPVMRDIINDAS